MFVAFEQSDNRRSTPGTFVSEQFMLTNNYEDCDSLRRGMYEGELSIQYDRVSRNHLFVHAGADVNWTVKTSIQSQFPITELVNIVWKQRIRMYIMSWLNKYTKTEEWNLIR